MKTRLGVIIFVFLIGMILWAAQPALLYGAETPEGNVWDPFIDPKPYKGETLSGPLSIYLDITGPCGGSDYTATMYYTVRLSKKKDLYTFQGKTADVCLADIETQGNIIKYNFLQGVVVPGIFPDGFNSWKFKSIGKAQFNDDNVSRAFVADIEIVVDNK